MPDIAEKCLKVVDGLEHEFICSLLRVNGTISPDCSDLDMLIDGFAKTYPEDFVKAVGAFLHDDVEVA